MHSRIQYPFLKPILKHGLFALLVVLLAACTTTGQSGDAEKIRDSSAKDASSPDRPLKKAVTITRFQVANSLQVEDISDIWDGYPLELSRRLEAKGNVVARHSTASPFPDPRNLNPDSPASRELIRRIAEQNGSQFVISGLILDAAISDESLRPYFGWQGRETGRRLELGLPWNSLVAGIRPVPTERRLEVEIFLHDGLSGALIKRHRDNAEISGRVVAGRNTAFASAAFFDTDFGQAVEHLLNIQIELIDSDLAQSGAQGGDTARSDAAGSKQLR